MKEVKLRVTGVIILLNNLNNISVNRIFIFSIGKHSPHRA